MAITRSGLKPGCTLNKSQKLRSRRPAATMSTRESANSLMTRIWRARERPSEPMDPRPSCRSVPIKSKRLMSQAGASPKTVPAATETARANASTPQLIDMSFMCGRLSGINPSRNFLVKKRIAKPAIPPSRKSSRLSARNWRMRRVLCAPRAWRTAISRPRTLALASKRLATLTQLISRTNPTAPNSRMRDWRTLPTTLSLSGVRRTVHAACAGYSAGYCFFSDSTSASRCPCAAAIERPGFKRATDSTLQTCTAQRGRKRQTGHASRQPRFRIPLLAG